MKKSLCYLLLSSMMFNSLNAATPIKNISEIAAGGNFILLLKQNKNVLALGDNSYGELGNGESGEDLVEKYPVTVISPSKLGVATNIKSVAGGELFTLILAQDSTVCSFGSSIHGELGVGIQNYNPHPVPLKIEYLPNIIKIACGYRHAMALSDDNHVYTWGWNIFGALGNPDIPPYYHNVATTPIQVVSIDGSGMLENIKSIAAGSQFSLALSTDGYVYSWGNNNSGQLGNFNIGGYTEIPNYVSIGIESYLNGIEQISAGEKHSLALGYNGQVYSWGSNNDGQLGIGLVGGDYPTVKFVNNASNIKSIACGSKHSLALRKDGKIYSWGSNQQGQLGRDSEPMTGTPNLILGLDNIVAISAGYNYSIALKSDGTVLFWGALTNPFNEENIILQSFIPIQLTEEMMQELPQGFFAPKAFY